MSADPNKKSGRSFQCRDVLWDTFEQMARELECSVDYLINEAMKQYARQRSYGGASRTPFPGQQRESAPPPQAAPQHGYGHPTPPVPPPPAMRTSQLGPPQSQRMPPPPMRGGGSLPAPPPPPPPQRGMLQVPMPPQQRGMSNQGMSQGMNQGMPSLPQQRGGHPRTVPPPIPRGQQQMGSNGFPGIAPQGGTLSVIYQGEKLPVTKDRFVIGRGKQSSDLTLKDPNVSRQHAMVEFQNGVYFMVDMGSTNGVEYNSQRIARKQITEGDVFKICDHEMRFTYR
jgi:pSer/pThr/pTyr-binding forkhead associated (FHA) protein